MSKIAEDVVRREVILLVFPEGTRSKSGKLGTFKLGSFKIATEQGIPILPCCITGAREILPKKKLMFRPGKLKIEYGKPIPVDLLGDDAAKFEHKKMAESLSKTVRAAILALGAEE